MKKLLTIIIILSIVAPTMADWLPLVVSDTDCIVEEVYHHDITGYVGKSFPLTPAINVIEPKPYPTDYPPDDDSDDLIAGSTWDNGTEKYFVGTGADWIWDTEYASEPLPGEGGYNPDTDRASWGHAILLSKTFKIPGNPISARMHITADNCYSFWINNGIEIVSDGAFYTYGWEESLMLDSQVHPSMWKSVEVYNSGFDFPITDLVEGENTLWVLAGNEDYSENTGKTGIDWMDNPGGVIFVLEVEYEPSIGNPAVDIEKYVGIETCSDNCCKQNRYQYRYQYNHQCGQQCGQQNCYQWIHQWCNQCGGCNNTCEIIWYDADEMTGPTVKAGETVYWRYVVENIGDVDLTGVAVWDDNGTDDENDDFLPQFLAVEVGDEDDILEVGEIWIYEASGVAVEGQYTNWGDVTTDQGAYDEDPANYFGEVVRGDEGCTPGFWKNNAKKKDASAWVGYSPGDYFSDVFGVVIKIRGKGRRTITDPTLLQALDANGSGINLLARAAVAALLNASNPDVAYALTESEVIAEVQDAVASGRKYVIQNLGNLLDRLNNGGCPLNQNGRRLTFNNCYNYNSKNKKSKWR